MTSDNEVAETAPSNKWASKPPRRMKRALFGASLVGMGIAGGGYLAAGPLASASTQTSTTTTATSPPEGGPPGGRLMLQQSGTVTAVGTSSVTIGSTVYAVDSSSVIVKNGEFGLSNLAVGDTVRFNSVTTSGVVTITMLRAGSEALDRPAGPPGGGPRGMALSSSGTVTAVGTSSITIGSTIYAVDSSSDIDKNGEATLSNLAVGDTVRFSTVTKSGIVTIAVLHAGSEALDRPAGPRGGGSGFASPA